MLGESRRARGRCWAADKPSLGGSRPVKQGQAPGDPRNGGPWWKVPTVPDLALVLQPVLAPQAEYDAMLLEHAGEAIPALAAAAGGDTFAPFFAGFLPLLLCKTVSAPFSDFEPPSACVLCAKPAD